MVARPDREVLRGAIDMHAHTHPALFRRPLDDTDLRALIDDRLVRAHRARALSPEHPVLRGSAQNPDVFFQAREAVNPYYLAVPDTVQTAMDRLAAGGELRQLIALDPPS